MTKVIVCSILGVALMASASGETYGKNLMPNSSFELGMRPHGVIVMLPFAENPVQPEVTADETAAVHGRRSLRIDNTRTGGEAMFVSGEVEVGTNGGMFAVSAYLKADRPVKVEFGVWRAELGRERYDVLIRRKTFEVGTDWTRVSLDRVRLSGCVSGFAVRLNLVADAVVWVDALQVERAANGGGPTDYEPAAPVEAAWAVDEPVVQHEDDEEVSVAATLCACSYGEKREIDVSGPAGDFRLEVAPGGIATRKVAVRTARSGICTIAGTFAAAGVSRPISSAQCAVVPRVDPKPGSGFRIGANGILGITRVKRPGAECVRFREGEIVWSAPLGYTPARYFRDLRRGGYSIARMHDGGYAWEDIEKEKGRFDWSKMDVIEAGLRANGLEPMFVFGSHGVFCTKHTGEGPETNWFARVNSRKGRYKGKTASKRGDRVFYHPADGDWTDWITAAVSRYHRTVKLWEIVNEPNGTVESAPVYAHYAELCYKAVKAVDPDATVIGICSTGDLGLNAARFFTAAGEAGAFKWLDAASFHPYAQAQDVPGKDGEEALRLYRERRPDLMLLDVMMPKGNGYEICETIRKTDVGTPVLFLTALDSDRDELRGLDVGADIYIPKTVSDEVLLARIAAAIRRRRHDEPTGDFDFADWHVDPSKLSMRRKVGGTVSLGEREVALLRWFAQHPGVVFSRDFLFTRFWGASFEGNDSTLSIAIMRLREKLGASASGLKSVRGSGYVWRP